MKSYIDETLSFIESEEMREYLHGVHEQSNRKWPPRNFCSEIVSYAPAPLERKIPVLGLIAAQTEPDAEGDYKDPAKLAQQHRIALEERYNNPPGSMFRLRDWCYHEEGFDFGNAFFTDFDSAMRYMQELPKMDYDADYAEWLSYSIDKYIPGKNGALTEYCQWVLNASGDIWYFDYDISFEPEGWDDIFDYLGSNSSLPVPFQPGDIILADCRPFSKERRVLILDIGDNSDCCCVQCLYLLPNGKVRCNAFKHNSFHGPDENSHISGLYRAKLWCGELSKEEAPLATLSAAIKANQALGSEVQDWIWRNERFDRNAEDDVPGAYLDELLEYVRKK